MDRFHRPCGTPGGATSKPGSIGLAPAFADEIERVPGQTKTHYKPTDRYHLCPREDRHR